MPVGILPLLFSCVPTFGERSCNEAQDIVRLESFWLWGSIVCIAVSPVGYRLKYFLRSLLKLEAMWTAGELSLPRTVPWAREARKPSLLSNSGIST